MQDRYDEDNFSDEEAIEESNPVEEISSLLRQLVPTGWGSYAWSLETINSGGAGNPIIDKIYDNATITCIFASGIEEFQVSIIGIAPPEFMVSSDHAYEPIR